MHNSSHNISYTDPDPHPSPESLEQESQRHQSMLEAVFAADPSGVAVLLGPELIFAYVNPAYRYITPDPTLDPLGQPYAQVWPVKSKHANRDRFKEVFASGKPFQIKDIEHRFPDGARRLFTLQARRMQWDGQPAVLVILWDVTDQKKAEEEIRSVALFPEQNPNPVLRVDLAGKLLYTNSASQRLLPEYRAGQLVSPYWLQIAQEVYHSGEIRTLDFEIHSRVYAFDVVPIPGSEYVNLYGRDVTERKRSAEELQHINARLQSILGSITELYVVFDREWRIVEANRKAELSYFPEEPPGFVLGKNVWKILPQTVGGDFYQAMHQARRTGEPAHFEAGSRVNGKWFEVHVYPRGDLLEMYMRDISERRQSEEILRESAARLNRAEEIAHLGSWELDLATNHLIWSDEIYRIFGLQPQEFEATYSAFLEAVHPEDRRAVDEAYSRSIRDQLDNYEIEHRVIRKSTGEVRFVHEKCAHLRDASGQIVRSIGMVQDITGRKAMEWALLESEEKYRELAECIADPVSAYDASLRCIYRNKASELATAIPIQQSLGKSFSELFPSLVGTEVHQLYLRCLETRQPQAMQTVWVHAQEGCAKTYELSLYPTHEGLVALSKALNE